MCAYGHCTPENQIVHLVDAFPQAKMDIDGVVFLEN